MADGQQPGPVPNGYRGDLRPVPDPTVLTQEAVGKLEVAMRTLVHAEIGHQRELFDEKQNGIIEKQNGISNQFAARVSAIQERLLGTANQYNEKLEGIANQFNEKLDGIATQFDEKIRQISGRSDMLDARTAEQKSDTKAALDAALAAQKEQVASQNASAQKSIDKSENTTTERIKGVEALLATSTKSLDEKINDLKDRVIAIEATKLGGVEQAATTRDAGTDSRAIIMMAVNVVLVLIAMASVAIAVLKP